VGPDPDGSSVGRDGKDVGRTPQGGHGNPARVWTERNVLKTSLFEKSVNKKQTILAK
jgi:hypothetical protein